MLESDTSKLSKKELNIIQNYTEGLFKTVREPLLVLDRHRNVVGLNSNLKRKFKINGEFEERVSVFEFNNGQLDTPEFRDILDYLQTESNTVTERDIQVVLPQKRKRGFTVNASVLPLPDENSIILLSFKKLKNIGDLSRQEKVFNRLVENILSNAPAAICILRGQEHTFEVANEHYIELIGHRDIIGKTVKEAIPEAESQGFIELLDHVYSTGEPYIGNETPLKLKVGKDEFKNSHLNFVYQPTRNKKEKIDGIFNFASPASPVDYQHNPIKTLKMGTLAIYNVMGMAKRLKIPILHASTSEVYGDPEVHPQSESYWGNVNPIGPRACYDEGKRVAESLLIAYKEHAGVDIRIARIFNTYGPHMDPQDGRVVSNFICQALKNEPVTIYGDGSQTRSFCYVDDLIEGIIRLMNSDYQSPVNLGNPTEYSILDLANMVISFTNSESELIYKDLPVDDPKRRNPNISLANKIIDWSPSTSLEGGLKKTIPWFAKLI